MRCALLFGIVLVAACSGPAPCTRTLCVVNIEGTVDFAGWSGTVRSTADSPKPPVVSDSLVTIVDGRSEFVNGKTRVSAKNGTSFKFTVSTSSIASIEVSSGSVEIAISTGNPVLIPAGATFSLPKPL